jgi:hypothetical protein
MRKSREIKLAGKHSQKNEKSESELWKHVKQKSKQGSILELRKTPVYHKTLRSVE